jgi:hypothetical protein
MALLKRILAIAGITLAAVIKLILIGLIAVFLLFDSVAPLANTPLGEYVSPDKKHICIVYVSDGGVLSPTTVVAEVQGSWLIGKRTIYVVKHLDEATVVWLNNRTIKINGKKLNIFWDKYTGDTYALNGG